jgi:hypothetical protein
LPLPSYVLVVVVELTAAPGELIVPRPAQIVGNFARLPAKTLNIVSGLFLGSRLAYSAFYFYQETEAMAWARSGAFFTGLGASLYVLFSSASKVRERRLACRPICSARRLTPHPSSTSQVFKLTAY